MYFRNGKTQRNCVMSANIDLTDKQLVSLDADIICTAVISIICEIT